MTDITRLERDVDSFDPRARRRALEALMAEHSPALPAEGALFNLHCHSFFSYNADGWSPSRVAWECRKAGLCAAGLCDFDVLDGVEEFIEAGWIVGIRTAAAIETRVYLGELADKEISSPGEPGVTYIMGAGYVRPPAAGTPQAAQLAAFREGARRRNLALVERINPHVPEMAIDYARDVEPLTPAGNATERHIISAYVNRARQAFGEGAAQAAGWSRLLGRSLDEAAALMADLPRLEEQVRSKLAKKGGYGYVQPSPDTFPPVDVFTAWVLSCDAIPMITWLDGTTGGEKDARGLLECLAAKGCVALNIIPDRNWNLRDPADKARKVANLHAIVGEAERMEMPINIGTEMNKAGLPFVDDLSVEALRPCREAFEQGMRIMTGHTVLKRFADYSYVGAAARAEFGSLRERNRFFEQVGRLPAVGVAQARRLIELGPAKALAWLRDAVRRG